MAPSSSAAFSPACFFQLPAPTESQKANFGGGNRGLPPFPLRSWLWGPLSQRGLQRVEGGVPGVGAWHIPASQDGLADLCSLFPSMFSSPLPPDSPHLKFLGCPQAAPYHSGMPASPHSSWPRSELPPTFLPWFLLSPGPCPSTSSGKRSQAHGVPRAMPADVTGWGATPRGKMGRAFPPRRCLSQAAAMATAPSLGAGHGFRWHIAHFH